MKFDSGYQVGVRANQNLGDYMGAALEYNLARQPLLLTNLSPSIPSLSLAHWVNQLTYSVSYSPMDRSKRFRPYGDLGVGAVLFHIAGHSKTEARALGVPLRDSWAFAFLWGGGLKYPIVDQFAFTVDVKDRLTRIPSFGIPETARVVNGQYQPGMALHGTMQTWQLNFGVTYQWDEP